MKDHDKIIRAFEAQLKAGKDPDIRVFVKQFGKVPEETLATLVMLRALYDSRDQEANQPDDGGPELKQLVDDLISGRGPGRFRQRYMRPAEVPTPLTREKGGVPVVRLAAAGQAEPNEPEALFSCEGWEKITRPFDLPHKEVFSVEIKGDSLEPMIPGGSVAVINPKKEARSGCLALVIDKEYRACVKKIKIHGSRITLISSNPAYPEQELDKKDVWKMYPVAWVRFK